MTDEHSSFIRYYEKLPVAVFICDRGSRNRSALFSGQATPDRYKGRDLA